MNIFDLHCDTATELYIRNLPFDNPETQINAKSVEKINATLCLAVFFNDETRNPSGEDFFNAVADIAESLKRPGLTPILTAEGAGVLAKNDGWFDLLQSRNCRMASLVWNGKNSLATGAKTDDNAKLTPLGREAVAELIRRGIAVDVSHLSAAGTEEILALTDAPIVASHSNAKAIRNHYRNLSDEVAREIFRRKGLVGLNLCPFFLGEGPVTTDDVLRHAEHFLALGGEDGLALGCDWDGAPLPEDMKDFSSLNFLRDKFAEEFGSEVTDRIFSGNATRFFA